MHIYYACAGTVYIVALEVVWFNVTAQKWEVAGTNGESCILLLTQVGVLALSLRCWVILGELRTFPESISTSVKHS